MTESEKPLSPLDALKDAVQRQHTEDSAAAKENAQAAIARALATNPTMRDAAVTMALSWQMYGWAKELVTTQLGNEEGLADFVANFVRDEISDDNGNLKPFDDLDFLRTMKMKILPFLQRQTELMRPINSIVSQRAESNREEFLSQPVLLPYESVSSYMQLPECNYKMPLIISGDKDELNRIMIEIAQYIKEKGRNVFAITSAEDSVTSSWAGLNIPFTIKKDSAHCVRVAGIHKKLKQLTAGMDVVIIEDIVDAVTRKKDEPLDKEKFAAGWKKVRRWAAENKHFIICGLDKNKEANAADAMATFTRAECCKNG